MAENVYRKNPNRFKQAFVALAANQTEGTIITGWDGEFNLLISSYSNEVNYQIREPAVLDEDGNEVTPATSWQTYETFTAITNDIRKFCSNYEYRFQTDSAGSRVLLGVQWGGPN